LECSRHRYADPFDSNFIAGAANCD
jgi:hypothetical protein